MEFNYFIPNKSGIQKTFQIFNITAVILVINEINILNIQTSV